MDSPDDGQSALFRLLLVILIVLMPLAVLVVLLVPYVLSFADAMLLYPDLPLELNAFTAK